MIARCSTQVRWLKKLSENFCHTVITRLCTFYKCSLHVHTCTFQLHTCDKCSLYAHASHRRVSNVYNHSLYNHTFRRRSAHVHMHSSCIHSFNRCSYDIRIHQLCCHPWNKHIWGMCTSILYACIPLMHICHTFYTCTHMYILSWTFFKCLQTFPSHVPNVHVKNTNVCFRLGSASSRNFPIFCSFSVVWYTNQYVVKKKLFFWNVAWFLISPICMSPSP